jgi:hypothetical protein
MRRRLAAKKSIRSPYYVEICRDFPYEIFSVIAKIVGRLDGFVEPFCFHGNNNKVEIISFTSVRLVNELFVLLSKFTSETVASYFKRDLSGREKDTRLQLSFLMRKTSFLLTKKGLEN